MCPPAQLDPVRDGRLSRTLPNILDFTSFGPLVYSTSMKLLKSHRVRESPRLSLVRTRIARDTSDKKHY